MQIKNKLTGESFVTTGPDVILSKVKMANATIESAAVFKVIFNDYDDL